MAFRFFYSSDRSAAALAAPPPSPKWKPPATVSVISSSASRCLTLWLASSSVGDLHERGWLARVGEPGSHPECARTCPVAGHAVRRHVHFSERPAFHGPGSERRGLVNRVTNNGEYFTPDVDPGASPALLDSQPSTLALLAPPSVGAYATAITVSAELSTSTGFPISNAVVEFSQNNQNLKATTGADGRVAINWLLLGKPGPDTLNVTFAGANRNAPAKASSPFTLTKQPTVLTLDPIDAIVETGTSVKTVAVLNDAAQRPVPERTVIFVIAGSGNETSQPVIADHPGRQFSTTWRCRRVTTPSLPILAVRPPLTWTTSPMATRRRQES